MQYLKNYLKKLSDRGNAKLAESVRKTAEEIGDGTLKKFTYNSHEIGLLFGNVQSGKTAQMLGIICKAADLYFPIFILLTADNIVLQQQTIDRVKSDLDGFCICGENDDELFTENSLEKPTIVVLKKNSRVLKCWTNILKNTNFIHGNPLFIIDDEADAASLNTRVNQRGQSSINKYLDEIKKVATSSLYLQVTGTPQALLLQTKASGWHPLFIHYFEPGDTYLGGDFFFPKTGKPDCVTYIETLNNPVRTAVVHHLIVSAQILSAGGRVSTCLLHPGVKVNDHNRVASEVNKQLNWCRDNLEGEFKETARKQYNNISAVKPDVNSFDSIFTEASELLSDGKIKVLIMNGQNNVDSTEYSDGCCFVVGGNTLGRGITFPSLQTIFYTRKSKNPQADTMWQHSRMFGYDRDPDLMQVYIDENLYKLFADINSTNNSIIAQIERGIENIKIMYVRGLNPTRTNVLDSRRFRAISGGTNYFPIFPDNDSIEEISDMLGRFSENELYYQVSLRFIQELLNHIIPSPDFKLSTFVSIIDSMLAEQPSAQGILIIRRNRDITQGTGALLSPNDWKLGERFTDKTVLTMYQVTGTKGWRGKQLWIPNIKLPDNLVFYDVIEDSGEVAS